MSQPVPQQPDSTPLESPTPTLPPQPASEKTQPVVPGPGPPPDGGFHAWATVVGSFLALFVQFGLANSFGVFQAYYEENQLATYSSSEISWIGALQQFMLFFGGIFCGRFFDSHGPHVILIPGSFLFVFSLMMTSLCTKYYQFILAQGIVFGVGSSMIFNPGITVSQQWFHHKRATAVAIAVSGSGIGGTLWPIALRRLFEQIGFAWALRTVGFISLFLLIIANLLIRTRLPRKTPAPWSKVFVQVKDTPYLLFSIGLALCTWGLFTPFFFVSTNATRLGADPDLAFYCLAFINAGSTIGRLGAGLGDRVGRFNLMIVATFMSGVLLLAFWIPLHTVSALIGFSVIYGFFAGMFISLITACIAQISIPQEIGMRAGLTFGIFALFTLTGPPIGGALVAKYPGAKGFQMAAVFSGVAIVAGAALVLVARFMLNKKLLVRI